MENILIKIASLEEKMTQSVNLLEIAKTYCEFNCDKSDEISSLFSILEIILVEQKSMIGELETALAG